MADGNRYFVDGEAYELVTGRWSRVAGAVFLDWLSLPPGLRWSALPRKADIRLTSFLQISRRRLAAHSRHLGAYTAGSLFRSATGSYPQTQSILP